MPDTVQKEVIQKVPSFGSFLKNPIHVVAYILLLYFIYAEFTDKDNCNELRVVMTKYEGIIESQGTRIANLETLLDVKNGALQKIENKLDSAKNGTVMGGYK